MMHMQHTSNKRRHHDTLGCPSLLRVAAPHNCLVELAVGAPPLTPMELDVSHNRLTSVQGAGTPLQRLDIAHNRIECLHALSTCRHLTWLDARSNRLQSAHPLATLPLLRALWLGGNNLQCLWGTSQPSTVVENPPFLPHLQLLHLQHNQELVSVDGLAACWRLTSLHLHGTGVGWPAMEAIKPLRRLRVLGMQLCGHARLAALRVCVAP